MNIDENEYTSEQLEQISALLDSFEQKEVEPKGGLWFFDSDGSVCNDNYSAVRAYRLFGVESHSECFTKQKRDKAQEANCYNDYVLNENRRTRWSMKNDDWYFVIFSRVNKKYDVAHYFSETAPVGLLPTSEETAEKIAKLANKGVFHGLPAAQP